MATMTDSYGTPRSYPSLIYSRIMAKLFRNKHTKKEEVEPLDIWLTPSLWYSPSTSSPSTTSTSPPESTHGSTSYTSLDEHLEIFTYPTNTLPVLFDNRTKPAYTAISTNLTLREARHEPTLVIQSHPIGTPQAASLCSSSPSHNEKYAYRDALDNRCRFEARAKSNDSGALSDTTTLYVPEECEECHTGVGLCESCGMERISECDRQMLWFAEERSKSERMRREGMEWKDDCGLGGGVQFEEVKWT